MGGFRVGIYKPNTKCYIVVIVLTRWCNIALNNPNDIDFMHKYTQKLYPTSNWQAKIFSKTKMPLCIDAGIINKQSELTLVIFIPKCNEKSVPAAYMLHLPSIRTFKKCTSSIHVILAIN